MQQLKKLHSTHQLVLRLLAGGKITLEEICEKYNLNLATYRQVVNCELFKSELAKLHAIIAEEQIQRDLDDPTIKQLQGASLRAAKRLTEEIDNFDEQSGASSSSRIKAADSVLDRTNYGRTQAKEGPQQQQNIIINLSPEKLAAVLARAPKEEKQVFEAVVS